MKKKPIVKVKIRDSEEMQTLRDTLKAISGVINMRYRVRERKNSLGKYASVEINRAKA